jgi:hypothetical protein
VAFSESLDPVSISSSDFTLDNGATVTSVIAIVAGNTVVILGTSPLADAVTYTLTVTGVIDLMGNPIGTPNQAQFVRNP